MKIDVITTAKCEPAIGTPYIAASVRVYGADAAAAVQAIEFVHDEGEVVYADAYERVRDERDNLRAQVRHLDVENAKLRERVDKLIFSLANAHGETGDLGAENARLIERNRELQSQLNTIGNNICKLANDLDDTNYVPF